MLRRALSIIAIIALLITTAGANEIKVDVHNPHLDVKLVITEKSVADDAEFSRGRRGYYVIVASALLDGEIQVNSIESAAGCTGVRPHFGLTKPTPGGFSVPAYAVYYGPYERLEDAIDVRSAVWDCVEGAIVSKKGVIQRF